MNLSKNIIITLFLCVGFYLTYSQSFPPFNMIIASDPQINRITGLTNSPHGSSSKGGAAMVDVTAVSWYNDKYGVYGVDANGDLHENWWDGATSEWRGWLKFGKPSGVTIHRVSSVSWAVNQYGIYVTASNGIVYQKWWNGSKWSGWSSLGKPSGASLVDISAVSWAPNKYGLYATGSDGRLYQKWWDGSKWQGWTNYGNPGGLRVEGIATVSWATNQYGLYITTNNGRVYQKWWNGSKWSGWADQGAPSGSNISVYDLAAVSWTPNQYALYAISSNGIRYERTWNGSSWTAWLGQQSHRPDPGIHKIIEWKRISTVSRARDRVEFLQIGDDNMIYQDSWDRFGVWKSWNFDWFMSKQMMKKVMKHVSNESAEGVIINGDLAEYGTMSQVDAYINIIAEKINSSGLSYYPALGNHDAYNNINEENEDKDKCYNCAAYWYDHLKRYISKNADYSSGIHYAFKKEDYLFVQLNVSPWYTKTFKSGIRSFNLNRGWDFLKDMDDTAKVNGLKIVLNMHVYREDDDESQYEWNSTNRYIFKNFIRNSNVVAIFSGHFHGDLGEKHSFSTNNFGRKVPVILTGAMYLGSYMRVKFEKTRMIVTPVVVYHKSYRTSAFDFNERKQVVYQVR